MLNVYWGQSDIFGRIKMRDNLGNEIIGNICRSNAFFTTCVAYYEWYIKCINIKCACIIIDIERF